MLLLIKKKVIKDKEYFDKMYNLYVYYINFNNNNSIYMKILLYIYIYLFKSLRMYLNFEISLL